MKKTNNVFFTALFAVILAFTCATPSPDSGSDNGGGTTGGIAIIDSTVPADVSNLASVSGDTEITLSWDEPADSDYDHVEITYGSTTLTVAKGTTTRTITGLTNGTSYTFTVKSVDTSGNKSSGVSITTSPADTTAPANVTGLTTTAGNTEVTLNWTPPVDSDFASVEITSSPVTSTYTVTAGTATRTITGLTNMTLYTFTVKSVDTTGNKSTGVTASATPAATFSVTYSGNTNTGGTAPTDSTVYSSGATVTVLANSGGVIKAGYKFDGWNTASEGTGTNYLESATFTGTSNITLYAKWSSVSYSLRDIGPAGGYIFYVNPNYATDGWRYLEAAPASTDTTTYVWGGYGTTVSGADGTAVGAGKQNTADIVAQFGATEPHGGGTYAAKICDDLSVTNGGVTYSDWFLPSMDELNLMYNNLEASGFGGFSYANYWSSSEYSADEAWFQPLYDGGQYYFGKYHPIRVRALRAF